MRKFSFYFLPFLFLFSTSVFVSCERDDDDSLPDPNEGSSTLKTQVLIHASDQSGDPVSGANIQIGNTTVTTDNFGNAIFRDVSVDKKRFIVKASKTGMFDAIKGVSIQQGNASYHVKFALIPLPAPANFSSSAGGNINLTNGATVSFNAGSIATANGTPYTGTVQVYAHHYSPDDTGFETSVPGGDLLGVDDEGNSVALVSFGMMNVQLQDPSGNPLNLLPGTTAQLSFPIAASQSATAPSTIPMWYLDETTSLWIEEGVAVKQGNAYVGTVTHFTYWNCDYQGERANITGTVVDCNNNPVAGAVVTLNGFMNLTTNSAGVYSTWVPAGWSISYQLQTQNNPWLASNSVTTNFTAISNQTNTIPAFSTPCLPVITGTTYDCTGNPVNTYILIQQGSNSYQSYQNSSQFSMLIPFTGACTITFYNSLNTFDTSITVLPGSTIPISLGSVTVCGTIAGIDSLSFMTFTGGPNGTQTFYFTNAYGDAMTDTISSVTQFIHSGQLSASNITYYDVWFTLPLDSIGTYLSNSNTYPFNDFYLTTIDFDLNLQSPSDYLVFNITNWDLVSGTATVSFTGQLTYFDYLNSLDYTVTVTQGNLVFYLYNL